MRRGSSGWAMASLCAALTGGVAGCAAAVTPTTPPATDDDEALPGVAETLEGTRAIGGFIPLWLDAASGAVWLAVTPDAPIEAIYAEALSRGLGANPAALDRGELGDSQLIELRAMGGRVVIEAINTAHRAETDDRDERAAAASSFPSSILWAAPFAARDPDGRVLVDIAPFLTRDAHDVARRLAARDEGTWVLDAERSAVDHAAVLGFPDNVELDAAITYTSEEPGDWSGSTAPLGHTISLRQHHSFVRLPAPGFETLDNVPRLGTMAIERQDFAAPLDRPLDRPIAIRHRLTPGEPLRYYLDRGAPEPVRAALLEGARWWNDAFERAGVNATFEVELLPEGAHPLDVRYNVIHWVHRSTRGWSYGGSVVDPRTGEILKANVILGSQRVRQDRRLFEGLLGATQTGRGGPSDPVELALARIRQLAAHEVGHTLGLAHNFATSTYDRASVMDYPAPLVSVTPDSVRTLDVTEAYAVGTGRWDDLVVSYLYAGQSRATVEARADAEGLVFGGDDDAHATGAAHPLANLWDNGADPVAALADVLAVREVGLSSFGLDRLAPATAPDDLRLTFAPLYFHHRYQVIAAAKSLAALDYDRSSTARAIVEPDGGRQRAALDALLEALDPEVLDVPDTALLALRPRRGDSIDDPPSFAGPTVDPLALAHSAAGLVIDELLQPQRAARMIERARRNGDALGFDAVLSAATRRLLARASSRTEPLRRVALDRWISGLVDLAMSEAEPSVAPIVRAAAEAELVRTRGRLGRGDLDAHLRRRIDRALDRRGPVSAPPTPSEPPPGSPIGCSLGP